MNPSRLVRAACGALSLGAIAWAALIVAAPWLASPRVPSPLALRASAVAYVAGSLACHQRPERSFHSFGAQWPVCARCTGLYLSAACGVAGAWAWGGWRRERRRARAWRPWLIVSALPTLATVALEALGAWEPSNAIRAAAGTPLGLVVGAMLVESTSFRGRLG